MHTACRSHSTCGEPQAWHESARAPSHVVRRVAEARAARVEEGDGGGVAHGVAEAHVVEEVDLECEHPEAHGAVCASPHLLSRYGRLSLLSCCQLGAQYMLISTLPCAPAEYSDLASQPTIAQLASE
jgi:hypothetical protein